MAPPLIHHYGLKSITANRFTKLEFDTEELILVFRQGKSLNPSAAKYFKFHMIFSQSLKF